MRIKPNRKLDKRSSRGMLYENEELRLRTIEINAEVERGQTDIKKLRRENDHLRREMWALRDEYERLEKLIKHLDLAGTSQTASLNGCSDSNSDGGDATASASTSLRSVKCSKSQKQQQQLQHHQGVYIECGNNPDMDNIQNYQRAYGRMPRRCSSAGARVYRSSATPSIQLPAVATAATSEDSSTTVHRAYESVESNDVDCSAITAVTPVSGSAAAALVTADEDEEDGYAACSHLPYKRPQFLRPPSLEALPPALPPLPPPLVIPLGFAPRSSKSPEGCSGGIGGANGGSGSGGAAGSARGEHPEDCTAAGGGAAEAGEGEDCPLVPPDTPSEDGHFNLDHLVNIVRSFREEQQIHQSGLLITTSSTASEEEDDDEDDDDDDEDDDDDDEDLDEDEDDDDEEDYDDDDDDDLDDDDDDDEDETEADDGVAVYQGGKSQGIMVPLPALTSFRRSSAANDRSQSSSPELGRLATVKRHRRKQIVIEQVADNEMQPQQQQQQQQQQLVRRLSSALPAVVPTSASTSATEQSVTFTRSSNPSGVVTKHSVTFRQNSVVFLNNNNNNNSIRHTSGSPTSTGRPRSRQQQRRNRRHSSKSNRNRRQQDDSNAASSKEASTMASCLSLYPLPDTDTASLLRLHAVDPYTVSIDLMDHPVSIRTVTVQELIDQLEMQVDAPTCVIRGVRMVGHIVYISLDSSRSLAHLMKHSFRIQGVTMRLVDVSSQQIIGLSNVPHYISDSTVAMLLAAFGTVIGDVERRFLQGVDTGERFIRLKIRPQVKIPRHITIGGCRIQVRRVAPAAQDPASAPASKPSANKRPVVDPVASTGGEYSSLDAYRRRSEDADCVPLLSAGASGVSGEEDSPRKRPGNAAPKIGKAFEYRTHLRVNLRNSADGGAKADAADSVVTSVTSVTSPPGKTPSCPLCEAQSQHPPVKTPTTPKPPLTTRQCTGERCRALAASASAASAMSRESPPKSRASVNFEETSKNSSRISNGILRKSASAGGEDSHPSDADAGPSGCAADAAKGKNGLRPPVKKTGRSFSLAETFRVKDRRKPVVRVETVVENATAGAEDGAQGVKTSVVRRDSVSSSRSSRSSRKSNELPWCGCWGNGCL